MAAQSPGEMKGIDRMHITPVIPDGYHGGPIKQLTCRVCKRLFYITQADFDRLQEEALHHFTNIKEQVLAYRVLLHLKIRGMRSAPQNGCSAPSF